MRTLRMKPENSITAARIIMLLLFSTGPVRSATLDVPVPYPTIQAGIDAAHPGDIVSVKPDTYTGPDNKNPDFLGKDIVLQSSDPVQKVVIDCEGQGRGLYLSGGESPKATVERFRITNGSEGGLYCLDASVTLRDCEIEDNNSEFFGSGCLLQNSPGTTFEGCLIQRNTTGDGGAVGIFIFESDDVMFENCTISNNDIAGLNIHDSMDLQLLNCTITGHENSSLGAGLLCYGSTLVLTDCIISNNHSLLGGGLYASDAEPILVGCTILNNSAAETGGGILFADSSGGMLSGCTITGNSAVDIGGGVAWREFSSCAVWDCTFTGNSANMGGGIHCDGSSPGFFRCVIHENAATPALFAGGRGGAIACMAGAEPELGNCMIFDNTATPSVLLSSYGGALYCHTSNPTITNCTFSENEAESGVANGCGGAVYSYESTPAIKNCILWRNLPDEIDYTGPMPVVTYSDVLGGWPAGVGNIDSDPLFTDPAIDDYHISPSSPCVDKGVDDVVYATDFEGDLRFYGLSVDMGADEVCNLSLMLPDFPVTIYRGDFFTFTIVIRNDTVETRELDEVSMELTGPVEKKIVFYKGNAVPMEPGKELSAQVRMFVPSGAPVGEYTGSVSVLRRAERLGFDVFIVMVE